MSKLKRPSRVNRQLKFFGKRGFHSEYSMKKPRIKVKPASYVERKKPAASIRTTQLEYPDAYMLAMTSARYAHEAATASARYAHEAAMRTAAPKMINSTGVVSTASYAHLQRQREAALMDEIRRREGPARFDFIMEHLGDF